jgi:uroporphyrinogen-III synthase
MTNSDVSFDPKRIFISRPLGAQSPILRTLLPLGYQVQHESLITTEQIRFTHKPAAQWIFFSSKNAIHYFFAQEPELKPEVKFGVMGAASANYLLHFNKQADFIGSGVDVTRIARDFATKVQDETVLFPQAIDSLQTVQKHLSFTNSCHNLFVYKTSLRSSFEVTPAALLVFTSPSNVKAYFAQYRYLSGQKVVAMGSSSVAELKQQGIKTLSTPESFDEEGLLHAIQMKLEQGIQLSI